MIIFTTLAYGVLLNYATSNINLTIAQKPTMTLTSTLLNTYNNSVTLFVNSTTKTIETTEPAFPLICINITNTGTTPIDKITLNDSIPNDWTLREAQLQLVQADQTHFEIEATYFTIEYSLENDIILTIPSIKNAVGKTLDQNESITIGLFFEYRLLGQQIPSEYETNHPIYTNTVAATAWVRNWQSQPETSILHFTTNITVS